MNEANGMDSLSETLLSVSLHERQLAELVRERDLRRRAGLFQYAQRRNQCFVQGVEALPTGPSHSAGHLGNGEGARLQILNLTTIQEGAETDWEGLVPVRLEVDHDGYKISDVLIFEANAASDGTIEEMVARQLCNDYDLPKEPFVGLLGRQIREQLEDAHSYRQALAACGGLRAAFGPEGVVGLGGAPVGVRLDIVVGLTRLEDRLEVALDAPLETLLPGLLRAYDQELESSLSGSQAAAFRPLILHGILEQIGLWRRALLLGGLVRDARSGALRAPHDPELSAVLAEVTRTGAAPLPTVRRHAAQFDAFTPKISSLAVDDLDRIEASRERDGRRRRRTGAFASTGAAATLRSPPRTLPTPTSYRGSVHRVLASRLAEDSDEPGRVRSRGRPRVK